MTQGRYAEAIPVYQTLVNQIPGNAGLLLNLAMAEAMGRQPKSAIAHCREVLKHDGQSIPALTMLSMSHLQLEQPAQALDPLRRLIKLTPDNVDGRGMLAGAEMSLKHFESAAQQYSRLTQLTPTDPKAWYGLGKSYEALAGERFEQLTKTAPESAYMAVLIGDTRLQRRQFRSAFFFYRQAEKQMPQLPGLHTGLASVYEGTDHKDWAAMERQREEGLLGNCDASKSAACQFARGQFGSFTGPSLGSPEALFWATRAYNQLALEAFRRLGDLPESVEMHSLKAQILHDHGQDLEAAKEWQSALNIAPEDERPRLEMELATSYFLGHDYAKAMPMLEELRAREPNSPDLNFMLGESLWRTQQAEKAVPYLESALARSPNMLPAHAALGLALVSLNRAREGASHLEKAASLDDDGSLHYSLARAYTALGNKESAARTMETYRLIQQKNAEINGEVAREADITAPSS